MEGMACKVPQVVPEWSALAEWARGGVHFVKCTSTYTHTGGLNTIGGIPDKSEFIAALDKLYTDAGYRDKLGAAGYDLVSQPKYKWFSVAQEFDRVFTGVLHGHNTKIK